MLIIKIFNFTACIISMIFCIIYGIVEKKYQFLFFALLILYAVFKRLFKKNNYDKNTLIIDLIDILMILVVTAYYFLSIFKLTNQLTFYIVIGIIIVYFIYQIIRVVFLRSKINKNELKD